ncbi:MAG: phosphodiester glycosidase family protein [bacterium]|nr:phosphodiester glycosidase family protein [bacterium]
MFPAWRWLCLPLLALLMTGCNLDSDILELTPSPTATAIAVIPPTDLPATAAPVSGWQELLPGLEQRIDSPNDNFFAQIVLLRIDPAQFAFRVHYRPGAPLRLDEWQAELPGTVAFVNANFFSPQAEIEGLLIADGLIYGESFRDRGGLFGVQNGIPFVRSNITMPYLGEPLEQAVQAFPVLIENGVQAYTSSAPDRTTRRTAIGQDNLGRIVLMATPLTGMTLVELSAYLASSDLGLVNAFNLDGGGSTMMAVAPGDYRLSSLDAVPAVLAVYPR